MEDQPVTPQVSAPRWIILKPSAPPAALLQAGMLAKQVLPHRESSVTLFEDKVHVRDTTGETDTVPRRYTLVHNDRNTEIFLSIGAEYDTEAVSRPQTRESRDEVRAELTGGDRPQLRVTCLVSGGVLTGRSVNPAVRGRVFESKMPFVLAIIRYGDRFLFERHPNLDEALISVEFRSPEARFHGSRDYGPISGYRVNRIVGESRRLLFGAAAAATALGVGALVYGWKRSR
jgi:hypothetical protein